MGVARTSARLAAGALFGALARVFAQDSEPSAPPVETAPVETIPVEATPVAAPETKPEQGPVLDEVVVTARRRKERLEDVPASIAVLDGQSLAEAGFTLPTDIQERVVGLVVSVPNARLTSYTIRGLGSSSANDGIESSVGIFLDGIYLGRQGVSIFDLIDLERVEVLRGPQGTLSGKNTTAGAINIVTRLPEPVYEAKAELVAGSLGSKQLRGSWNDAKLDGSFAGRLTGYLTGRDGTVDNVYNGQRLNDRDKFGARTQGLWTFDEHKTARVIAEYGQSREACCSFPLTAPVRETVQARDDYMEYTRIGTHPEERRTDSDAPTRSDMRQMALSGEVNWDLGGTHTLTAVGGVRDWFFLPLNDDATSLKLASTSTKNKHRQFSQEVRIASHFELVDSVVGVYYCDQLLHGLERVILGKDIAGWVFGGEIRRRSDANATQSNSGPALYALIPPESFDGMTVDTGYFQRSHSAAAFGSADWKLGERFTLTTGLRYTYEWKSAEVRRTRYGGDPNASPLSAADPIGPVIDAQFPELGQALGQDAENASWKGLIDDVAGGEYERGNKMRESNPSAQLALSYAIDEASRVYASAARGYKGGGINLGFTGSSIEPLFRPEVATSFEVGSKLRLFNRMMLSLAAYNTVVTDYQALTFDNEATLLRNPRQINLLNIGKVRLRGYEIEGYGYAAPGLMVRAALAYSDTLMTNFPNAPNELDGMNTRDLSGQELYNAPSWTSNYGAEYQFIFDNGRQAFAGLDWSFRSGYWGTVEHGTSSYIQGYNIGNARVGLRAPDRHWDVSIWSRNITNKDYLATVYPLYGVGDYGAITADPRTFGATLRMEWQ